MKGICIDAGNATTLEVGKEYYLFEHGPSNYYVSRFNNKNSHFGSYQRSFFKTIEVRPHDLKVKHYAKLKRPQRNFDMDKTYIVGPAKGNGEYYNVYSLAVPTRPFGSYINNVFEILEPYEEPEPIKEPEPPQIEELGEIGINTPTDNGTAESERNLKPSVDKMGQLNIFDFLEG